MPKTSTSKGSTITIRVGPNTKQAIQQYAKLREMTVGEFVRYSVLVYMDGTPADPNDDMKSSEEIQYDAEVAGGNPIEIVPGGVTVGD